MPRHLSWVAVLAAVSMSSVVSTLAVGAEIAPAPQLLWPAGAPGKVGDEEADRPAVTVYPAPADRATGAAVVVCPGGGYGILAVDHEGHQVARWLNSIGVTGVVLRYRLAPRYRHPAPLQDAQRAIRYVRSRAAEWQISPRRIGVMGFSAGGHLASTAATHFDAGTADAKDPIDRLSCRPDFAVLCYPVISFTAPFAHRGSARNLLGDAATEEQLRQLSNDQQVTAETPPTFLFHTGEDTGVPAENSVMFYLACRKAGVSAELHIYRYGPHGVGLSPGDPVTFTWKDRLASWLLTSGFLSDSPRTAVEGTIQWDGEPLMWGQVAFTPTDGRGPPAFAMVRNGKFNLPAASGPGLGNVRISVTSLGDVKLTATADNFQAAPNVVPETVELTSGKNPLTISARAK